jgi:serine/threonine-protein kinase RsbW
MEASQTVSVPGTPAGVRQAADAVLAFTVRTGVPEPVRRKVMTALDEVLSNVVRHGLRGRHGTIDVVLARDDDGLRVVVADPAEPFNPLLVPAPDTTAPLEARRAGGLGIALVRALADAVGYERVDDRNRLTLTWRCGAATGKGHHAD